MALPATSLIISLVNISVIEACGNGVIRFQVQNTICQEYEVNHKAIHGGDKPVLK